MSNITGRPTKMTDITLKKLEEVFALGGTDEEACFYAGISHQTLYDYQKKNKHFLERKQALKLKPILKARKEVIKGLDGNPEFSLKFLERKKRDEFGLNPKIVNQMYQQQAERTSIENDKIKQLAEEYEDRLRAIYMKKK